MAHVGAWLLSRGGRRRGASGPEGLCGLDGLRRLLEAGAGEQSAPAAGPAIGDDLTLEELERLHIAAVLRRYRGNRTRTAEVLGIERKSLYRKAERLGIALEGKENRV